MALQFPTSSNSALTTLNSWDLWLSCPINCSSKAWNQLSDISAGGSQDSGASKGSRFQLWSITAVQTFPLFPRLPFVLFSPRISKCHLSPTAPILLITVGRAKAAFHFKNGEWKKEGGGGREKNRTSCLSQNYSALNMTTILLRLKYCITGATWGICKNRKLQRLGFNIKVWTGWMVQITSYRYTQKHNLIPNPTDAIKRTKEWNLIQEQFQSVLPSKSGNYLCFRDANSCPSHPQLQVLMSK